MPVYKPIIGIVGAGKVGQVLARSWSMAGYEIGAIYSPTRSHAEALAIYVDADVLVSAYDVFSRCDLTILCVPDDVIGSVATIIAGNIDDTKSAKAVIHVSGSRSTDVFDSLLRKDVMVGSLHPAFPFSSVEASLVNIRGATFALESEHGNLSNWLVDLVYVLDGRIIRIPDGGKALYHLALVLTSNYTVTLYSVAEQLLMGLGAERDVADQALNSLLTATVDNIRNQGIPSALTGPLSRSDIGTLDAHLNAIPDDNTLLESVYVDLARLSYPMLVARGIDTDLIENFLQQGGKYAVNDS